MHHVSRVPLLALAALLAPALVASGAAFAQTATTTTVTTTAAPGAAPVAVTTTATTAMPMPAVPGPTCAQPAMPKGPLRSKEEADALNAALDGYQKCIAAYSAEHKALADAHMNAANGAVRGFNTFATELSAAVKPPAK